MTDDTITRHSTTSYYIVRKLRQLRCLNYWPFCCLSLRSGGQSHAGLSCFARGSEWPNPGVPNLTTLPVDPGGPRGPCVPTPGLPFSPFSPGKPKEIVLWSESHFEQNCAQYLLFNGDYSSICYFSCKNRWQRRKEVKIQNYLVLFPLPSLTASQGKHGIPGVLNIPPAMVVSSRWYAEASASFQAALPAGKLPLDYTKVQVL